MPELVIGLCTHGDTLRVARLQAINTWETRAFFQQLQGNLSRKGVVPIRGCMSRKEFL